MLSVTIFKLFAGLDMLDAVYFTVTIITTTGFGDIHLRDAPAALQVYGMGLMLFGAAALAILFALITDVLVSARLAGVLGGLPRQLRGHVIVCSLGNIGYRVIEHLIDLDVPVVAAEQQETNRFLPAVRRLGVPVLIADIRPLRAGRAGICRGRRGGTGAGHHLGRPSGPAGRPGRGRRRLQGGRAHDRRPRVVHPQSHAPADQRWPAALVSPGRNAPPGRPRAGGGRDANGLAAVLASTEAQFH